MNDIQRVLINITGEQSDGENVEDIAITTEGTLTTVIVSVTAKVTKTATIQPPFCRFLKKTARNTSLLTEAV